MIKVAIVEDNPQTLSFLTAILSGAPGCRVQGSYATGSEALAAMEQEPPEVLLCDLNLPDMSGIDVIKALHGQSPDTDILVLTLHQSKEHVIPAFSAGASGYILKGSSPAQIIEAVMAIRKGGAPMSPAIARHVLQEFSNRKDLEGTAPLTPREAEILSCLAVMHSEQAVAEQLVLSPHTVHSHIKNIYKKLRVRNRADAISKARAQGFV